MAVGRLKSETNLINRLSMTILKKTDYIWRWNFSSGKINKILKATSIGFLHVKCECYTHQHTYTYEKKNGLSDTRIRCAVSFHSSFKPAAGQNYGRRTFAAVSLAVTLLPPRGSLCLPQGLACARLSFPKTIELQSLY